MRRISATKVRTGRYASEEAKPVEMCPVMMALRILGGPDQPAAEDQLSP
ncbi:MAG: hypothetical protein KTR25_19165 [Myxococcales bacterium]|nr:hypothetical protein [Myxococcales bacterium]